LSKHDSEILTNYYLTQIWYPVQCCTIPGQSGPDNNYG